jgi:hypothetical protein
VRVTRAHAWHGLRGLSICTGFAYMPLKRTRTAYRRFEGVGGAWVSKKVIHTQDRVSHMLSTGLPWECCKMWQKYLMLITCG